MGSQSDSPLYVPLTEREQEILKLLAEDLSDREIADHLVVATTTVKWYNRQIFNKLGANTRKDAVAQARALGLLEANEQATLTKHNLPAQLTPFIGRIDELNDVKQLLLDTSTRLITILAAGGMGKTRLALAAAEHVSRHFPAGVFFVPLAPLTSVDQLIPTIADAVDYQFMGGSRSAIQQLLDYFRSKQLLLILDNFEHLLEGISLISDILQGATAVKVLVTSRERLNLNGETVYPITGLPYPVGMGISNLTQYASVQLFSECAHRASPQSVPVDDTVARICQFVQGMPLAIELAAAWVGTLPLSQIELEIRRNTDFLRTTMHNVPERLRSVRGVIEATWQRLNEDEQQIFRRLSVFRGGFTFEAAQTVAGANIEILASLVDKALLWRNRAMERYEIHELLRQYALQLLEATGEAERTNEAQREYYANYAHHWSTALKTQQQLVALDVLDADLENLRSAFERSITIGTSEALEPFADLWYYFEIRGRWLEAEKLFAAAVATLEPTPSPGLAKMLAGLVVCLDRLSAPERWRDLAERSANMLRQFSAEKGFLLPLWYEALAFSYRDQHAVAKQRLFDVLDIARQQDDHWATGIVLHLIGREAFLLSQFDEAKIYIEQAFTKLSEFGNVWGMSYQLNLLGWLALKDRNYEDAELRFEGALFYAQRAHHTIMIEEGFTGLILLAAARRDIDLAKQLTTEVITLRRSSGRFVALVDGLTMLSEVENELGQYHESRQHIREIFSLPIDLSADLLVYPSLLASELLTQLGKPVQAAGLLSFFEHHRDPDTQFLLFPDNLQKLQTQLHSTLAQEIYNDAWERGKTLTVESVRAMLLTSL